jgi:hypothetical protein
MAGGTGATLLAAVNLMGSSRIQKQKYKKKTSHPLNNICVSTHFGDKPSAAPRYRLP